MYAFPLVSIAIPYPLSSLRSTDERRIHQRRTSRIQLGHEHIIISIMRRVIRSGCGRVIGCSILSISSYVCIPSGIDLDIISTITTRSADECRVINNRIDHYTPTLIKCSQTDLYIHIHSINSNLHGIGSPNPSP